MPNWCQNVAYIKHEDKAELEKIVKELDKGDEAKLFNSLVPNPSGEWDYNWSVENWGTKWDASVYEYSMEEEHLYISFDTAWGPPIEFYNKLGVLGFEVEAFYREEGMGFAGWYIDGEDNYYEYANMSADEIENYLPERLDEMFSISQYQRDWEQENSEEEEDFDPAASLEDITKELVDSLKEDLRLYLHKGVVKVVFTKKDGTDRTMLATLNEELIPEDKKPKGTGKKVDNGNTFAVYDVEADGWRSFNYDTVKEVDYGDLVS